MNNQLNTDARDFLAYVESNTPRAALTEEEMKAPKPVPRVITSMDELEGFTGKVEIRHEKANETATFALSNGRLKYIHQCRSLQHALNNPGMDSDCY